MLQGFLKGHKGEEVPLQTEIYIFQNDLQLGFPRTRFFKDKLSTIHSFSLDLAFGHSQ
jgi:hypothetical protein